MGDFSEEFGAPLVLWSTHQYEQQWREAARQLIAGAQQSCFVAAMRPAPLEGPVFLWPAYRDGDHLCFRHHLVIADAGSHPFDPENPCAQIGEREPADQNDACEKISEWRIPLAELAQFIDAAEQALGADSP